MIVRALKENGKIFLVENLAEAIELGNRIAPEHLEILTGNPEEVLEKIVNAGAVFIGPYSPVALGDYFAGPNHTLPTNGCARFASPLTVFDFLKYQSIIGYSKDALYKAKENIVTLAETEGLDGHARAVEERFKEPGV